MPSPNPAQLYEDYLVPGIHARWTPLFLQYADPRRGEHVLDLGCGTGIVSRHVAEAIGSDGSVTATDVSPHMLEVARELPAPKGGTVTWQQCDATSLPQEDGTFDLVLCQQAFQFFDDREAAAREMRRVLAPHGRAVVSVWQGLDRHPVYNALCQSEARSLGVPVEDVATPFMMGDPDDLREPLERAGFSNVRIRDVTHDALFPAPERFVALTVLAAASIIPDSEMDEASREQLVRSITDEVEETLRDYRRGDTISFPMHAHVAVARA